MELLRHRTDCPTSKKGLTAGLSNTRRSLEAGDCLQAPEAMRRWNKQNAQTSSTHKMPCQACIQQWPVRWFEQHARQCRLMTICRQESPTCRKFIFDNHCFSATNSGPLSETKVLGTLKRLKISGGQRCTVAVDRSLHGIASIQGRAWINYNKNISKSGVISPINVCTRCQWLRLWSGICRRSTTKT